ncbi:hypothetical protein WJX72_002317 [[Myrmecia] bisecta]|uniref:Uncharacterized protein n=1 Tax=[Myrmecia] bisecta TaxID=41462 RepID=A0AAW1R4Z0_9CHLO
MEPELVDLTGEDDERPVKRARPSPSSDDEVMFVENQPAEPANGSAAGSAAVQEGDIEILNASGVTWNKDLAHARQVCGHHAFSEQPGTSNRVYCDKCYCYVCDVKAAQCTKWGTGAQALDHCNATDKQDHWKQIKKGKAVAAPPSRPPASALPGSSRPAASSMMPSVPSAQPAAAADGKPSVPARPANVRCLLKEMPDPTGDPALMEIGVVSLRVKVMSGNIHDIKQRLSRFGFYHATKSNLEKKKKAPGMDLHGDRLSMENLACTTPVTMADEYHEGMYISSSYGTSGPLKICKFPMEPREEPTPLRARSVHICHYDGKARPTTYAVQLPKKVTVGQMKEAMTALVPLAPGERWLACWSPSYGDWQKDSAVLPRPDLGRYSTLQLHRMPEECFADVKPEQSQGTLPTLTGSKSGDAGVIVVMHRRKVTVTVPRRRRDRSCDGFHVFGAFMNRFFHGDSDEDDSEGYGGYGGGGSGRHWCNECQEYHGEDASEEDEDEDEEGDSGTEQTVTRWEDTGVKSVLPLRKGNDKGGPAANKRVVKSIWKTAAPFRKEGVASALPANALELLTLKRTGPGCYDYGVHESFKEEKKNASVSVSLYGNELSTLYLFADWEPDLMDKVDFEEWRKPPPAHESASEEVMKAAAELFKGDREWDALKTQYKKAPQLIFRELQATCVQSRPGISQNERLFHPTPTCALVLDLEPRTALAEERRGMLHIRVFAWRSPGVLHRQLFSSAVGWTSSPSVEDLYNEFQLNCPLQHTMEHLLRDNARFQDFQERMKRFEERENGSYECRTLKCVPRSHAK